MTFFPIEQALFGRDISAGPVLWARSDGFGDGWVDEAKAMIQDFGSRPANVGCPAAVFARPFGPGHVAVVHVADQAGTFLGFHFLIVSRRNYEGFLGDPFQLVQKLPAPWTQRGSLPAHSWPFEPLPARTVEDVRGVLRKLKSQDWPEGMDPENDDVERTTENSESPALLGSAQVLVEGGRVVFERPAPATDLLQGLWTLLPGSTRSQLWPASFAFSNRLRFDVVVVPKAAGPDFDGYTSEAQAIEYPEGYYELNLQIAAESGNQDELDALLNRRSVKHVFHLFIAVLALLLGFLAFRTIDFDSRPPRPSGDVPLRAAAAAGVVAAGDPWTALGILRLGNHMWANPQGEKR